MKLLGENIGKCFQKIRLGSFRTEQKVLILKNRQAINIKKYQFFKETLIKEKTVGKYL